MMRRNVMTTMMAMRMTMIRHGNVKSRKIVICDISFNSFIIQSNEWILNSRKHEIMFWYECQSLESLFRGKFVLHNQMRLHER